MRPLQRRTPALVIALATIVGACGPEEGFEAPDGGAMPDVLPVSQDTSPYRPVADMQRLMFSVLEPAAQDYWDAVGWIIDADGEHEIRPTSDHDWEEVENAAWVVAEAGNLLMMPGRAPDDGAWIGMSQAMMEVAERAIQAAEARDEAAVFEVGGELYYTCTACHSVYAVETLRPNARIE
jgi:hypothetical protein